MTKIPSIIVVSCSSTKPKSLIKLITKISEVSEDDAVPGLVKQLWSLDTKYYTAEVNLIGIDSGFKRTMEFNDKIEALILHMDSNKETGLNDLNVWESIENDCNLEVKLLVSNYCNNNTKVTKTQAIEWCLKRGYEFIELYPTLDQTEQDQDFIDKFGVDRIIEALHSHTWSSLVMKNCKRSKSNKESSSINLSVPKTNIKSDDNLHYHETDDFTELFSQLHMMKDSLQGMPVNQRKQCAEQVVTAFWKAIGGEDEELFDI